MLVVIQEVVDVVRHWVEVEEHIHVDVEVIYVSHVVEHDVVDVVRHCVLVDDEHLVFVEVT
jgi:hypothetical protein